jgi:hypothetical protein
MPQHMVAFFQNAGFTVNALTAIAPVADPTVNIQGTQLYVPTKYNKVLYAGVAEPAGLLVRAQLQSPSLRELYYPDIQPLSPTNSFDLFNMLIDQGSSPMELKISEPLAFYVSVSAAGGVPTALVILGDDKVNPVSGKIMSIYATSVPTLVAGTWVNGPLTFNQLLPVGDYDIVGWRAYGTGLTACRLVFIGASSVTRPGVFGQSTNATVGQPFFRQGYNGVYGTFNYITPPTVDHIGTAGAITCYHIFDLIKH